MTIFFILRAKIFSLLRLMESEKFQIGFKVIIIVDLISGNLIAAAEKSIKGQQHHCYRCLFVTCMLSVKPVFIAKPVMPSFFGSFWVN